MKRLILLSLLSSLLTLSSCSIFDSHLEVDYIGYNVKTDIVWDYEYMSYTLRLSLDYGEDGDYLFNYSIDSDAAIYLKSDSNMEFLSGSNIALSKNSGRSFLLPTLSKGAEHTARLSFEYGGIINEYTVKLPETNQTAIGVSVNNSSSLEYTEVTLSNLMGASSSTYEVSFSLDGQPLSDIKYLGNTFNGAMSINFAGTNSYLFQMPYLVPGDHVLKVDVTSSQSSESITVPFKEPQRRSTALSFSYNQYTGNLMVQSSYNPINTAFSITVDMTVRGKVTYRHPQFFGIADEQTEYFTLTGESSVGSIVPGLVASSIDGGKLKTLMDGITANTREHAENAIGNANQVTFHAQITSIELKFSTHSLGTYSGATAVSISPSSEISVSYTYSGLTNDYGENGTSVTGAQFVVNGKIPYNVSKL